MTWMEAEKLGYVLIWDFCSKRAYWFEPSIGKFIECIKVGE